MVGEKRNPTKRRRCRSYARLNVMSSLTGSWPRLWVWVVVVMGVVVVRGLDGTSWSTKTQLSGNPNQGAAGSLPLSKKEPVTIVI